MKIRALLIATAITHCSIACAAIEGGFRCLTSYGKKSISLEFHEIGDAKVKWSAGYVLYKGSKQAISIVLDKSEVIDRPPDRPWEFEDTWVEISGGKITGSYTVSHQGANITSFIYKSAKEGKEFSFDQDLEHTGKYECKW